MKNLPLFTVLATLCIMLYGCPVGLDYPLGKPGEEKIDKRLTGTWDAGKTDGEAKTVSISEKNNFSYTVVVKERGEMYSLTTDTLTGWVSRLENKLFFYLKPSDENKYYHYMVKEISEGAMTTCDVSLLDGGVDAVTSTETLRAQVLRSVKMEGFCTETTGWTKK